MLHSLVQIFVFLLIWNRKKETNLYFTVNYQKNY